MLIKKALNESNFYLFSSGLVCYTTVVDYKLIQRMCCFIDHICFFLSKTGLFDIYILITYYVIETSHTILSCKKNICEINNMLIVNRTSEP